MDINKEREAFSAWVVTHPDNLDITDYEERIMFDAWCAAKSQAVPEGCLLMPRKCTNKMAHAAKAVDGRLSAFKYANVYGAMVEAAQEQAND